MKTRNISLSILLLLAFVMAFIPQNTTQKFKLTPQEMLLEVREDVSMLHPDIVAQMIIDKDPSLQLIDVRTPAEYEAYHLTDAINVPLSKILDDENFDYLNQDARMNVLYSNGTSMAQSAWMLVRQLGYENNFVLQGGLNYWTETILNPKKPTSFQADDEIAKYNFRKGASQHFGGAPAAAADTPVKKKPVIRRSKKKKAPAGGC